MHEQFAKLKMPEDSTTIDRLTTFDEFIRKLKSEIAKLEDDLVLQRFDQQRFLNCTNRLAKQIFQLISSSLFICFPNEMDVIYRRFEPQI